jgi:hypothetical protein
MKKILVLAALIVAGTAAPTLPAIAADEVPEVESKCYVLPLLPDCAAQWNDYWQSKGYHLTTPYAWWTCKKAADDAGHLIDCDSN